MGMEQRESPMGERGGSRVPSFPFCPVPLLQAHFQKVASLSLVGWKFLGAKESLPFRVRGNSRLKSPAPAHALQFWLPLEDSLGQA